MNPGKPAKTRARSGSSGVTLVELMIATAILSICIIGLIASFGGVQKGIQVSKNATIASNLAQEKMQILKQMNYYAVLATVNPSYNTTYTPNIPYDNANFPAEAILEGGVNYQRLTYIQVADVPESALVTLPPTTPDTGMKLVTITVLWTQGSDLKKVTLTSIFSNPNTVMGNAIFTGTVKSSVSGNPAIPGALVNVAENLGWSDMTDNSGVYTVSANPGNYTLMASAKGYYPQLFPLTGVPNHTVTQNFTLTPISSGTVTGTAWMTPNIEISQVVASTRQADNNNFAAQYIELFNPTASPVVIGGVSATPNILVKYQTSPSCSDADTCADATTGIKLNYINTTIAAGGYYIIANTTTFMTNGIRQKADAIYADDAPTRCSAPPDFILWNLTSSPQLRQILDPGHGGALWLTDASGNLLDYVGWLHIANPVPNQSNCGASGCVNLGSGGFTDNLQLVRTSSPSFADATYTYGRAYDSGNSALDWVVSSIGTTGIWYRTFGTDDGVWPVIAGVPAIGAVASANDGLSNTVSAAAVGSPPKAVFSMTNVATGTWIVLISSGQYTLENDTVAIAATGSTFNFPSSTTFLNQPTLHGFIAGTVLNITNAPISGGITVSPGTAGPSVTSGAGGRYLLRVSTGFVNVTANPSNANSSYISVTSAAVPSRMGQVWDGVNFVLSQGGRIKGFVTRDGTNPLPGIAVAALDANGQARDQQVSDITGHFTTVNIATGIYTMQPAVDSLESWSPYSSVVTVTAGQTVFSTTFTISGALGTITGRVSAGGSPISTGVLIVVTTGTISGAPPTLSSMTLASTPYYTTSSLENGTYSVDVRQSTYTIYGYYETLNSAGAVTINPLSITNVSVTPGVTVSGKNFAW